MNAEALHLMAKHLRRAWRMRRAEALDVGALDVNGTYRPIIERRGWHYTGLDIAAGPNVDVVAEPYRYPLEDGAFDVVLSGSTMEHVAALWRWAHEVARVLRPGGLMVLVGPHTFREHRYPADYWRIMPQGMDYLLREAGLERIIVEKGRQMTAGSGWKP